MVVWLLAGTGNGLAQTPALGTPAPFAFTVETTTNNGMSLMNNNYGSRAGIRVTVGATPLSITHLSAVVGYLQNTGNTGFEYIDVRAHQYRVDVFSMATWMNSAIPPTQSLKISGNGLPWPIGLDPQPVVIGGKTHYYPSPALKHGLAPNGVGGTVDAYKIVIAFPAALVLSANSDYLVMLQTEHDSPSKGLVYLQRADDFVMDGMQTMPEGYRISATGGRFGPISATETYALRFGTAPDIIGELPIGTIVSGSPLALVRNPLNPGTLKVICPSNERGYMHIFQSSPDLQSWVNFYSCVGADQRTELTVSANAKGFFRKIIKPL